MTASAGPWPILPLKNAVLFPRLFMPLSIGRSARPITSLKPRRKTAPSSTSRPIVSATCLARARDFAASSAADFSRAGRSAGTGGGFKVGLAQMCSAASAADNVFVMT